MASEMGIDRDGLVNQALFTFARLNGYMMPGQPNASVPGLADAPATGRNGSYGPTSDVPVDVPVPMPDRAPPTDRGAQMRGGAQAEQIPPTAPRGSQSVQRRDEPRPEPRDEYDDQGSVPE